MNNQELIEASLYGRFETVKLLLENGADIHASYDEAIREASCKGHFEIVKLLLENGANIHACNDQAIRLASGNGHLQIVKLLLENGANIHALKDECIKKSSNIVDKSNIGYKDTSKNGVKSNDFVVQIQQDEQLPVYQESRDKPRNGRMKTFLKSLVVLGTGITIGTIGTHLYTFVLF
jgi:ankyrin repeat protein